ncbi:MAG: cytochrome [Sphingomonas bacterium]|uniref:c-type cytochrome n=1 Tax=Sphingomonas bacterium TaxID=1895847 RepID=UPI002621AD6F|nr:c-type cytochrome [Sphingomonas bacterium]MDB5705492.1 cytochrome [Sphingomonas bacterium]
MYPALYRHRRKLVRFGLVLRLLTAAHMVHAQTVPASEPPSGARLFTQQCGTCHSVKPGEVRAGPSLAGIIGKTAGKQAGFAYSPALKSSSMTWNAANIDRWLTDSSATVAGSFMNYRQVDPAKRKAIVTFLSTGK